MQRAGSQPGKSTIGDDKMEPESVVPANFACPSCGERDMDNLIFRDDCCMRCGTCGRVYSPAMRHGPYRKFAHFSLHYRIIQITHGIPEYKAYRNNWLHYANSYMPLV
jgi:hypothetical protein